METQPNLQTAKPVPAAMAATTTAPSVPTTAAAASRTDGAAPPPPPATQKQKILLFVFLLTSTVVILVCWCGVLKQLEAQLLAEHKVPWIAPASSVLKSGPPAFTYDRGSNLLCFKGTIDAQTKKELASLLVTEGTSNPAEFAQTYSDAIGRLAYAATDSGARTVYLLLLLGGLSAMLGVQLRSIVNCMYVICYKRALDALLWWPWYVFRPLAGFLIGFTVVLLVKAEVLFKGEAAAVGSLWWAGVALLAGFGASEFAERLRLLSQTMFGEGDSKSNPKT